MSTEYKYNAANNHWEHHQTTNDDVNVVMVVKANGSSSPTNDDRTIATDGTSGTNSCSNSHHSRLGTASSGLVVDENDDADDLISCISTSSSSNDEETAKPNAPTSKIALNYRESVIRQRRASIQSNYNKIRLTEFYKRYNPKRVASVDDTLRKYAGHEDDLLQKMEGKYGRTATSSLKLTKSTVLGYQDQRDSQEESDEDDDDDDPFDAPMSVQMQQRMTARKNSHYTAMDSMKLIPHFHEDEDDGEHAVEHDETKAITEAVRRSLSTDSLLLAAAGAPPMERKMSFGVRPQETSTTPLKLATPLPRTHRTPSKISFNELVTLNHVDSFKHELTAAELEEVWYTEVELVIMKVDCGLFSKAAENQHQRRQQEIRKQRQLNKRQRPGMSASSGGNSCFSNSASPVNTIAKEKRAKELRRKYKIDKKLKELHHHKKTNTSTPAVDTKKKKKNRLASFFGKKQ